MHLYEIRKAFTLNYTHNGNKYTRLAKMKQKWSETKAPNDFQIVHAMLTHLFRAIKSDVESDIWNVQRV